MAKIVAFQHSLASLFGTRVAVHIRSVSGDLVFVQVFKVALTEL